MATTETHTLSVRETKGRRKQRREKKKKKKINKREKRKIKKKTQDTCPPRMPSSAWKKKTKSHHTDNPLAVQTPTLTFHPGPTPSSDLILHPHL